MADLTVVELAAIAIALDDEEIENKINKRTIWVHDLWKKRESQGEFFTLFKDLMDDETKFFQYFRMTKETFHILLDKVEVNLRKQDTHWRKSVTPKERLAVCLRYLATGDSLQTILFSYRLGHSTVYKIVMDTCKVICETLLHETMPKPNEDIWKTISTEFNTLWNFPNCLGSLDGKHVIIQAPPNSGSQYFNYKKTFSVVLLALVDAKYNFIMVDVGAYGKNSDGGIFTNSNFYKAVELGKLSIPSSENLPQTTTKVPYVMVGDEAFPLKTYLMRPYSKVDLDNDKRIYNYRLSRARRVVENAFGILCQKFRIYNRRFQAAPKNVDYIVLTTCILHNFVKKYDKDTYSYERTEEIEVPGHSSITNLPSQGGNASRDAFEVRETFKHYFKSEAGSVSWQ